MSNSRIIVAASIAILAFAAPGLAAPQRPGNGGQAAKSAPKAANRPTSGPAQGKRSGAQSSVNPSHGKNKGDTDITINKSGGNTVNVNSNNKNSNNRTNNNVHNTSVHSDRRYGAPPPGYRSGGYYSGGHYYYDDDDGLGFVGKVAIASTAALVVGAILTDKPDNCEQSMHNGQVYMYCNGTWYQPMQSGSNTSYVVVNKP